jgi:hypothetical protein
LKDQIKSRLLDGDKFAMPRGSGKTQAIVELLLEHEDRFVAVVPNERMARLLMKRYQEYRFEQTNVLEVDVIAKRKVRALHGNQAFPIAYHDYLADEMYMFSKIPFFLYGGVGTPSQWVHPPESEIVVSYFPSPEEEFAWHFEPRP